MSGGQQGNEGDYDSGPEEEDQGQTLLSEKPSWKDSLFRLWKGECCRPKSTPNNNEQQRRPESHKKAQIQPDVVRPTQVTQKQLHLQKKQPYPILPYRPKAPSQQHYPYCYPNPNCYPPRGYSWSPSPVPQPFYPRNNAVPFVYHNHQHYQLAYHNTQKPRTGEISCCRGSIGSSSTTMTTSCSSYSSDEYQSLPSQGDFVINAEQNVQGTESFKDDHSQQTNHSSTLSPSNHRPELICSPPPSSSGDSEAHPKAAGEKPLAKAPVEHIRDLQPNERANGRDVEQKLLAELEETRKNLALAEQEASLKRGEMQAIMDDSNESAQSWNQERSLLKDELCQLSKELIETQLVLKTNREQSSLLKDAVKAACEEIKKPQSEISSRLRTEQELREELASAKNRLSLLETWLRSASKESASYREERAHHMKEMNRLKEELNQAKGAVLSPSNHAGTSVASMEESLQQHNARLKLKIANFSKTREQTNCGSDTLEILRRSNADMAARWQKEKAAQEKTVKELDMVRAELRATQQQLAESKRTSELSADKRREMVRLRIKDKTQRIREKMEKQFREAPSKGVIIEI